MDADRDAIAIVTASASFGAVRAAVGRVAAVVDASSAAFQARRWLAAWRALPIADRSRFTGVLLLTASVMHGAIIAFVPRAAAPAWPLLAPAIGALVGAIYLVSGRR